MARRHFCHPIRLDREEAQTLLAQRGFFLLAFSSDSEHERHRLAIKARANLEARDYASLIGSPEEAVRIVYDLRGLEIGRCSRLEGLYHLVYDHEQKGLKEREREIAKAMERERYGLV